MARIWMTGAAGTILAAALLAGAVSAQEGFVTPFGGASSAPAPAQAVTTPAAAPAAAAPAPTVAAPAPQLPVIAAPPAPQASMIPAGGAATAMPPAAEIARLRTGIAAADAGDWTGLRNARAVATDPLVRRILQWRLASDQNAPASFDEIKTALDQLANWPGRETMRRRAEQQIFDSALTYNARAAWLKAGGPLSGDGKVALAQSLKAIGQGADANTIIRAAWRENILTPRAEQIALMEFGSTLTTADHAARVDWALWRDDRATASRLMARLGAEDRAVAQARIALQTRPRKGLQAAVDRVPSSRADDPGFLYDRVRYIRRDGRPEDAMPIAARIPALSAPMVGREAIFKERRLYVPRALKAGDRTRAYRLVADHGLTQGESFADAEWMAGWLALRFTRDAASADRHFTKMDANVSAPVSKSRALYWRAMASKQLNQDAAAQALLTEAAKLNFTYYGQIAASKVDSAAVMSLGERSLVTPAARAEFESREVVRALKLMADVGDQRDFESIAFYLDDQLTTPLEHEMLSLIARERAYTRTAVRSAKAGIRRGIIAPDAAYPLLDLPADARKPGRPEPALILAITRQESEFDPRAHSSAGARGLMQIMPATARITARSEGLPYQPNWLVDDPSYNVTLGAAYLQHLLETWNGSYVLTIASYNAGPGRPREWIGDWGDPRASNTDVVDWVELIPFSETRNYVQRVMENVQVYRHRIAGTPVPLRIEQDLKRGAY